MKRYLAILVPIGLMIFFLSGCANILDGQFERVTMHVAPPYEREPVEQIAVSDILEFREVLIDLMLNHETETQIIFHHFGADDIQEQTEFIANYLLQHHPIGAYAAENITVVATRVVTYFEVDIYIEYKRTAEEVSAIIQVPTERRLILELERVMRQHADEAVFQTTLQLTEEDIIDLVRYIYYDNPSSILMLPIVAIEKFPEVGQDQVYLIQFSYVYGTNMMRQFNALLEFHVEQAVGRVVGDTESLRLLFVVRDLAASIEFDEGAARTISVHGAQHFSATAYGALVRGRAAGEGFAMAFKILSDKLGFDNRIVLGYLDERIHAWNVVYLEGYHYHIDVAMASVYGLQRGFLMTDDELIELGYQWDRENTVICNGPLTYNDILQLEEPEDNEDNDESNNETDETSEANQNDETGSSSSDEEETDNSQDELDSPDEETESETGDRESEESGDDQLAEEE